MWCPELRGFPCWSFPGKGLAAPCYSAFRLGSHGPGLGSESGTGEDQRRRGTRGMGGLLSSCPVVLCCGWQRVTGVLAPSSVIGPEKPPGGIWGLQSDACPVRTALVLRVCGLHRSKATRAKLAFLGEAPSGLLATIPFLAGLGLHRCRPSWRMTLRHAGSGHRAWVSPWVSLYHGCHHFTVLLLLSEDVAGLLGELEETRQPCAWAALLGLLTLVFRVGGVPT